MKKGTVRTIDCTPTWSGILPLLLTIYRDGSDAAVSEAEGELRRMALLADAWVSASKLAEGETVQ